VVHLGKDAKSDYRFKKKVTRVEHEKSPEYNNEEGHEW
jgi:hypothetical protein